MEFKNGDKILCKRDYHESEWYSSAKTILQDNTIPLFEEGKYYTVTNIKPNVWLINDEDEENFIEVNSVIMEKRFFYTKKEERKLKLQKIENDRKGMA